MPLSEEIQNNLNELLSGNRQNEITPYLRKQLKDDRASAVDIYTFLRSTRLTSKTNPYVNSANTLNSLGLMISNLGDKVQSARFYKLAAKLGSYSGYSKYARRLLNGDGVEKSPEKALEYAEKAVELCNNKGVYKFLLCRALRENSKNEEATSALMDYLDYQGKKAEDERNENNISKAMDLCEKILEELNEDCQEGSESDESLGSWESSLRQNLLQLQIILNCKAELPGFHAIQQKAYLIKARHHEGLGENSKAWVASCFITDRTLPFYHEVFAVRKSLLRAETNEMVNGSLLTESSSTVESDSDDKTTEESQTSPKFMLPNGITLPAHFEKSWEPGATWFHTVNETDISEEFEKRLGQIKILIELKKKEISTVENMLADDISDTDCSAEKQGLADELTKLREVKQSFKQKHEQYLPRPRRILRRHLSERHFFDPERTNKTEELMTLTEQIIEQRYNLHSTLPNW